MRIQDVTIGLTTFLAAMTAITAAPAQTPRKAPVQATQADPIGDLIEKLDKQDAQAAGKARKSKDYTSITIDSRAVPVRKDVLEGAAEITAADHAVANQALGQGFKASMEKTLDGLKPIRRQEKADLDWRNEKVRKNLRRPVI